MLVILFFSFLFVLFVVVKDIVSKSSGSEEVNFWFVIWGYVNWVGCVGVGVGVVYIFFYLVVVILICEFVFYF